MSLIACEVCIEAITPSFAKRGMSAAATTWACSMRKRGSATGRTAAGTAANAFSYWSSTTRLPRSPIACVSTWMPQRRRRDPQDLLGRGDVEATAVGRIAVGRLERRAAAAERAVHEELDGAHGEPRVAALVALAGREQLLRVLAR